jgi:hypothetical protein
MATMTADKVKKAGLVECSLNDILFPVEMIEQTEFACNSDYSHDIFGYIGGDIEKGIMPVKTRLNSCSDRYVLIPNAEIFLPIRQTLIDKGIKFEETYMHLNNARFYAEYKIMDNPYKVAGTNDLIYPMLRVQHSYNGLTKYVINFGYYRLVCSNGLTIPVKEMIEFNINKSGKHTDSIHTSLAELSNKIDKFIELKDQFVVNFNHMADRVITNIEDRVTEVMAAAKFSLGNNKKETMAYISTIVNREAVDLYGGVTNDFLIYNAINAYINDNSQNVKAPEVRNEMDRKVMEIMLKDYALS